MEDEERREAAIVAALQSNRRSPSITQDQINKLKELRKKRLQIKASSKIKKKSQGNTSGTEKADEKKLSAKDILDETVTPEYSSVSTAKEDKVAPPSSLKSRQKLHWGLDTKERWERKANM